MPHAERSFEILEFTIRSDIFIAHLENKRKGLSAEIPTFRGKRLKVVPSKSLSVEDVESIREGQLEKVSEPKKRGRPKKSKSIIESERLHSSDDELAAMDSERSLKKHPRRPRKMKAVVDSDY